VRAPGSAALLLAALVGTAGGQCQGDSDCKLYPAGVGECCGSCIPATEPQPPTVQCLVACLTPLKSCTCVSHQCKGSNTLL